MSITALNTALVDYCLDAAEGILVDCRSRDGDIKKSDAAISAVSITATSTSLHGCGAPIISLLGRQAVSVLRILSSPPTATTPSPSSAALTARRLDDLIELAHARFYAHVPSQVPVCWRQLYTDASILKFALAYSETGSPALDGVIDSLVQPLDMALILAGGAGPPSRGGPWIHAALELLHSILDSKMDTRRTDDYRNPAKRPRLMSSLSCGFSSSGPMFNDEGTAASHFAPPVRHPVLRSGPLGLEGFQAYLDRARHDNSQKGPQPLVMTGLIDNWPARRADSRPWGSPDYLRWRTLGGQRLVPVEVGRSYVDAGWRQEIVKFESVLQALQAGSHAPQTTNSTMYLAQHSLFTQIPKLRDDICIPDACYSVTNDADTDADDDTEGQEPMLNAWLGPAGTITPLHTDPHHNLLAQVVGRKYVRLYSPEQSAGLRPRGREGGVEMGNTSAVDVGVMEGWDTGSEEAGGDGHTSTTDRERFLALAYRDCILEPGDTLYIPRGWWHYVRGLSVSFSVSFWWD
ncbi:hypothetical protein F503_05023 [Ophiostoma piceae UAMH 11346]|uniref:JmjC domain-containing protein n=1 Tax=Ophiostoma piceae (strain UAMH 11346) TaxID=1262450 RepID=S3CTB4_OPHP1|nr:hypothetical protein F503_05023 [Ophiostoma piceae UAMH 11346]